MTDCNLELWYFLSSFMSNTALDKLVAELVEPCGGVGGTLWVWANEVGSYFTQHYLTMSSHSTDTHVNITEIRIVSGSLCLVSFFSYSMNVLLPVGSYFSILNLRSGCRSGLPRGIIS